MKRVAAVLMIVALALPSFAADGEGEKEFGMKLKDFFEKQEELKQMDEEVEEAGFPLTIGLDFVSRYVWRGIDFGASPAIQPYVEYSVGDKVSWGIGVWASQTLRGRAPSDTTGFSSEFDIYTYLSFGPATITFTDYFFPTEVWGGDGYFTYKKALTGHVYELMLSLGGDFPLYGTAAVNLGGADQNFSSYFEIGATVYDGIDLFVSAAYDKNGGYYLADPAGKGYKFMVTQVGMSASYEIQLNKVKIPLSAAVIFNPDSRNAWFVAAIGLSN